MSILSNINDIGLTVFLIFFYLLILKSIMLADKKFECKRCGRCCRLIVWLTEKDIALIKTKVDYVQRFLWKKYIRMKKGRCIFLKTNGISSCSIYDMRPDVCRRFPDKIIFGLKAKDARCRGLK